MISTRAVIKTLKDEWKAECRRLASTKRHGYTDDPDRAAVGFMAERAVIEYLLDLAPDRSVKWLVNDPRPTYPPGMPYELRKHPADILWCGRELEVKLTYREPEFLRVKVGAQDRDHIICVWHRHMESIRVLGVILRHQPETFEPSAPLSNPRTGKPFTSFGRPVNGWLIPCSRLQPLSVLLQSEAA